MLTLRILMAVVAISLLVAAALHAGILIAGPLDQAAYYEGTLGVVMLVALGLTLVGPGIGRIAALVAQAVTLAGASVGLYLATRGLAPDTTLDIVYHVALIVALLAGLVVAWRLGVSSGGRD